MIATGVVTPFFIPIKVAAVVAFNLFQLLGKLHHDAILPPPERTLDGAWARPGA